MKPFKAFIFDMDNTLLQSRIDFYKMKKSVYELLVSHHLLPLDLEWSNKTPSQIIELGRRHQHFPAIEQEVWTLVEEVESEGMEGAKLEPYTAQLLSGLRGKDKWVSVLTNNALPAAEKALKELSVFHLFDYVAGRDQMEKLKPSPSGVLHILNRCPTIPKEKWVMVGDSWIDGMAAQQAGISFIAYQADSDHLAKKGVYPLECIRSLQELEHWS
ncbi:HAD family hydrolase [Ammoniphilus sp. CFH 90114]|uniref:HAD family hydrolase n=1 Tax=Ammoniphilus sp. CFH 90114 TaxID=2493665 RepID=UPI0013E98181|nr:HAD family hydrolase [Ammoniphilus sp. CFH 90114]